MNKKEALEAAYLAGFNSTGDGYNGEYPFDQNGTFPEDDPNWIKQRDANLKHLTSKVKKTRAIEENKGEKE